MFFLIYLCIFFLVRSVHQVSYEGAPRMIHVTSYFVSITVKQHTSYCEVTSHTRCSSLNPQLKLHLLAFSGAFDQIT